MKKTLHTILILAIASFTLNKVAAQTNLYSTRNGDFEGLPAPTSPPAVSPYYWWNFYNTSAAAATLTDETTPANVHGGSHAGKVVVATAASNYQPQLAGQPIPNATDPTHTYQITAWVKSVNGVGKIQACNGGSAPYLANTTITTSWMKYTTTFTGQSSFNLWFNMGGAVETFYIDDIVVTDITALPVNLVSFTAAKTNTTVNLNWSTGNEVNNNYFSIERSANGTDFNSVGTITSKASNGNSSSVVNYSFQDDVKGFSSTLYYRIKQVDADGKYAYSTVVSVANNEATVEAVAIYPNPISSNAFNIKISVATNGRAVIKMVNIDGKLVANKAVQLNAGTNMVSINNDNLAKGMYILQVYNANSQQLIGTVKTVK